MTQTLLPYDAAKARHYEKTQRILRFLRTEKWTHQSILQHLLGLSSRQAIHKTLQGLERKDLVKRHSIDSGLGPNMTVWGITTKGVMLSFDENERPENIRAFEASKLKPSQINHSLDIQRAQVKAESAGWTEWRTAGFVKKGVKAPDAIAKRPDGITVAIEVERSLKALRRYPDILVSHLAARKQGLWSDIYYLMPDESMKKRVKRCFDVIEKARYQKKTHQITQNHKSPFKFFTYGESWHLTQKENQNV